MVDDDRRRFQRLKLAKPILARMGDGNALILDIGIGGAFVEHYGEATPGQQFKVAFRWQSQDVEFETEVARSEVVKQAGGDGRSVVSHTGLRFVHTSPEAETRLQDMLTSFIGKLLAAQRANANGDDRRASDPTILEQIGEARRKRRRGFISYRLVGGKWWRVSTESPLQPVDGFTVPAFEEDEELEALCSTYESADEDGRRLIRLVAELSVRELTNPS